MSLSSADQGTVSRRGLLPVGVLSSSLPLLVLFGSNTFTSAQIALLQLLLLSVIQVLSSSLKIPRRAPRTPTIVEPIKVEVVNGNAKLEKPKEEQAKIEPKERSQPLKEPKVADIPVLDYAPSPPAVPKVPETPQPLQEEQPEHPLYSNETLDACLRNFLAVLDPDQLRYLPKTVDPTLLPEPVPLDDWQRLVDTPASRVAKHPVIPHLYSISAAYPDVPLRNLWELMINIENRPKWDSMCQEALNLESIGTGADRNKSCWREASVDYLATKGMFLIKANDMVLLSINARLYPKDKIRLVCATTSVEHPDKPPTSSFSRMQLSISGFIAEDDGTGGSRVTQITDLSALGSWVPSRVIRMVTENLIPKSLVKIGMAAKELQVHGSRAMLQGEDWLPPTVGSWNPVDTLPVPRDVSVAPVITDADETQSDISMRPPVETEDQSDTDNESTDSLDEIPASSARDLRQIVVQLRSLNARLDDLEKDKSAQVGPVIKGPPRVDPASIASPPNGHSSYRPPPAPFGVNKVTENALTSPSQPMGWMSRLAGSIDIGSFVRGIGAGVFSTTTAATLAAILVYFFRKRGFSFTK
ncbi:Bet v1-like protein [Cystobasidium minutum MCA 4210]|uniref:Bet v1-like protein n=1 Tax=Cystobasidium minutum MCA 4210 TaxID=1397322 RepID=UPI0034CEE09A|eukprot:jgi/Rhomi1/99031/CE99030_941